MEQTDLFSLTDWKPKGATINPTRDTARLAAQMQRVHDFVFGAGWTTLGAISEATGDPEASVSARLRDLRDMGFTVEREFVSRGLQRYRVSR